MDKISKLEIVQLSNTKVADAIFGKHDVMQAKDAVQRIGEVNKNLAQLFPDIDGNEIARKEFRQHLGLVHKALLGRLTSKTNVANVASQLAQEVGTTKSKLGNLKSVFAQDQEAFKQKYEALSNGVSKYNQHYATKQQTLDSKQKEIKDLKEQLAVWQE